MNDCDGPLHEHARLGIALFNAGHYFEAHEELEAAWRQEKGKIRELYQGILEAGVTYLHITRGNYWGAMKVYKRSMRWLKDWPDHCRGVDVSKLRRDLNTAIAEVERLGEAGMGGFDREMLKPVRWNEAGALDTKLEP
jgi:predicted metal-dependent hydrolase